MSDEIQTEVPAEVVAKLKAANPGVPLESVPTDLGVFVIRPAPKGEYDCWVDAEPGQPKRQRAQVMVKTCVLYPEAEERDVLFETYPGLVGTLAAEILQLSGHVEVGKRKKL